MRELLIAAAERAMRYLAPDLIPSIRRDNRGRCFKECMYRFPL